MKKNKTALTLALLISLSAITSNSGIIVKATTVNKSSVVKTVAKKPLVKKPAVKPPVIKKPVVKPPVIKKPAVKPPVIEKLTTTLSLYDATSYFKDIDYTELVYVSYMSDFIYSIILEDGKILIAVDKSDPQNGDVDATSTIVVGVVKDKALVSTVKVTLKPIATGKTKVVNKNSSLDKYVDFIEAVSQLYTNDNLVYEFNVPINVDEEEDDTIKKQPIASEKQVLTTLTLNGVKPKSIKKVNLFADGFNQYQVIMPEKILKYKIIINVDGMYIANDPSIIKSLNFVSISVPRELRNSSVAINKKIERSSQGLVATTLTTDLTNDFSNVSYDTLKIIDQTIGFDDTNSCTVDIVGTSLVIKPININAESIVYYNKLMVVALKDGLPVKYGSYDCVNIYYKSNVN